jgi:hypothetical protein
MTNAKSRGETTQLVHDDFLVIDIRKLCSRNTGSENNTNYEHPAFPQHAEPLEDVDYLHIGSPGAFDAPQLTEKLRIQFEFETAYIFLKKANGKSIVVTTSWKLMAYHTYLQMLIRHAGLWSNLQ